MRIVLLVCLVGSAAHADDRIERSATPEPPSRHLFYVELLGKAGTYGIGYEYLIAPWLSFGGAVSYAVVTDQRIATAAPYLHVTLRRHNEHALYTELGAAIAHSTIPSAVSDWKGMTNTGGGGLLSLGYEHASRHAVFRIGGGVTGGLGGVGPMIGISIGGRP